MGVAVGDGLTAQDSPRQAGDPAPPRPPQTYGRRERWGPYHRQAVRFVGRRLERIGSRLDSWSWGWR